MAVGQGPFVLGIPILCYVLYVTNYKLQIIFLSCLAYIKDDNDKHQCTLRIRRHGRKWNKLAFYDIGIYFVQFFFHFHPLFLADFYLFRKYTCSV